MYFKVLLFFTFYTATYYSGYNVITLSFTSAIEIPALPNLLAVVAVKHQSNYISLFSCGLR